MKLFDIIEVFIAGDWGEETYSKETPCAVTCVRGADIIPISEYDFSAIPVRYISQQAYAKKCLQVGDIIIEKSGGSPTQSTGRVSLVSQELLDHAGAVICSNFCTAFRVKKGWNPLHVYYYLQFIYNLGAFFNFEGKTSGIKNLQLDAAFAAIPTEDISESIQNNIVVILQGLEKKIAINRQINLNFLLGQDNGYLRMVSTYYAQCFGPTDVLGYDITCFFLRILHYGLSIIKTINTSVICHSSIYRLSLNIHLPIIIHLPAFTTLLPACLHPLLEKLGHPYRKAENGYENR